MAWQWFGQWQPCILDILQSIIIWHYFTSLAVNCSGKERLKCIVHFYAITSVNSLAEWTRRAICAVHDWSWWTSPLDNCNLFTALAQWSARWQIRGRGGGGRGRGGENEIEDRYSEGGGGEREQKSWRYEERGKAVLDRGRESQCSMSNLPSGTVV